MSLEVFLHPIYERAQRRTQRVARARAVCAECPGVGPTSGNAATSSAHTAERPASDGSCTDDHSTAVLAAATLVGGITLRAATSGTSRLEVAVVAFRGALTGAAVTHLLDLGHLLWVLHPAQALFSGAAVQIFAARHRTSVPPGEGDGP